MTCRRLCFFLCIAVYLSGCASKQGLHGVLSENDEFIVVAKTDQDSYESLAASYMGDAKFASVIARYNPSIDSLTSIAIPRKTINSSAVFASSYQVVPVLCYHQFTNKSTSTNRMIVTKEEFTSQMRYLQNNGFEVISLKELAMFINGALEIPDNAVVITIDDGYKSYQEIALPILKQFGYHSTMFVYPDFVGARAALSWDDIQQLENDPLVSIQSHSKSHDSLSFKQGKESKDAYLTRLESEVDDAQQLIQKRLSGKVEQFAYPYGDTGKILADYLRDRDYEIGLTVQRGENAAFTAPFFVRRTMIFGGDPLAKFSQALVTEKRFK